MANGKGGVAKTTTAVHLAAAFGERGEKVCLVDLDSSGAATRHLGVPEGYCQDAGAAELILGHARAEDVVVDSGRDGDLSFPQNVALIGGTPRLDNCEAEIREGSLFTDGAHNLRRELNRLRQDYSYLILDTAPNVGLATRAAYLTADYMVLACEPERSAVDGLLRALAHVREAREAGGNRDLELLGIVMSNVDGRRTTLARELLEGVGASFRPGEGLFDTLIPRRADVAKAEQNRVTLFQYNPRHEVADSYRTLAKEVAERITARRRKAAA